MSDETPTVPAKDPREISFPYEFPLSVTIQAHGEDTKVLVLREPTGEDVLKFGLLEGLDQAQFAPLVCSLASIPEGAFKKIPARDVLRLGTVLSRFFQWAALPPA